MEQKTTTEQYHTCDDCGRNCYTGGDAYPNGYTCADCDEDEEEEVYGVCFECGKEGKFIGKEGDDWQCERCCDMCHHGSDSDEDEE